ncbi:hypothetical protein BT67DRAFT_476478 [Trichocladium antarcticum]|uniref:Malate dehydrogenase n=1 Tax=Trichocladium antarcticum TaxID=1450529 RepID=A0AAN6UTF3_9PEZI|nr:hypothetical protein BT67DRAFT_476478 [Trichocladium antarcticum]
MHASLLLVSALAASVWAAPTYPQVDADAAIPDNIRAISEYFNLLASKVQDSRILSTPPTCDLSQVSLPAAAAGLPPPSAGLTLKHIAIGRGTQNYTCDPRNSTAAPVPTGAVATLFNASCVAATSPALASVLGRAALHFSLPQSASARALSPSNLAVSGRHYFTGDGVPFFDLDVAPQRPLGAIPCGKAGAMAAPATAGRGLGGESAVPWLKLTAKPGATGGLQEVYRVETVGGSAPATCSGMPAGFEVQYVTQYWFYAK